MIVCVRVSSGDLPEYFTLGPLTKRLFRLHLVLMSQRNIMLSDFDIFRAAHFMMHEYGDDAELEAAIFADRMLKRGDTGKSYSLGSE